MSRAFAAKSLVGDSGNMVLHSSADNSLSSRAAVSSSLSSVTRCQTASRACHEGDAMFEVAWSVWPPDLWEVELEAKLCNEVLWGETEELVGGFRCQDGHDGRARASAWMKSASPSAI